MVYEHCLHKYTKDCIQFALVNITSQTQLNFSIYLIGFCLQIYLFI